MDHAACDGVAWFPDLPLRFACQNDVALQLELIMVLRKRRWNSYFQGKAGHAREATETAQTTGLYVISSEPTWEIQEIGNRTVPIESREVNP